MVIRTEQRLVTMRYYFRSRFHLAKVDRCLLSQQAERLLFSIALPLDLEKSIGYGQLSSECSPKQSPRSVHPSPGCLTHLRRFKQDAVYS